MSNQDGISGPMRTGTEDMEITLYPRKAEFGPVPDSEEAAREKEVAIAALAFTARFASGPVRSVKVDFSKLPMPRMAREIAQIVWDAAQPGGKDSMAGTSFRAYQSDIKHFSMFVGRMNEANGPNKAMALRDISPALLDEYEAAMKADGLSELTRYNTLLHVRQLLILANERNLASEGIAPRLEYVTALGRPKPTPKDIYDDYVMAQIREAARQDLDSAVQRITVTAPEMLLRGHDPEVFGYECAENIIWGLTNGTVPVAKPRAGTPLYAALLAGQAKGDYRQDAAKAHSDFMGILHLLFPSATDIFAAQALLCLETGLPPTSIRLLKVNCLRNEKGGFADLAYVKERTGVIAEHTKRVSTNGKHSVGAIIKKFVTIGRAARDKASDEDRDYLFVGCGFGARGIPIGCRLLDLGKYLSRYAQPFVKRHGITESDGVPLRDLAFDRLKKTHTTDRYRKVGGSIVDAIGKDKAASTAARHYLNVPGTAEQHDDAIAKGLQSGLDAAVQTRILTTADEQRLRTEPDQVAADLGVSRGQVDAIANEDNDVWFASCLGFRNSPYSGHGEPCSAPIWGCLECANAVIGTSKLPAILAFVNFIVGKRQEMNLETWGMRYGRAHARITQQILPRFPASEIADAKAIASAEGDLLWLPAELVEG